ncbi:MAG: bifunctional diaminohydroxyphosphoribosylaminopyrimidine deaminase/5-amino-6-(5-phosphoribosylamino)uracil reductase RibD [Deltaproteobacteria bacterium]|nr:bifunctional diaminohydroxyphosphoribosylaminopyrimidine deaminase/5-amino-6-(5-phosphoribosylamino)uracil reductase RibD [Deltaproteobacteria bacterium]
MFEKYMKLAIAQARKAIGRVSPNPMVGAVVVKRGEIVSLGYHRQAGSPHAEINALKKAGKKAKNADLYINLEPCCHYGRTPPCVNAIIDSGIKRVIVGIEDPNPLVSGKGIATLNAAGIITQMGVLKEECRKLNEIYIKYITRKVPFVVLKIASSLDGKIAARSGDSRGITSQKSIRLVHKLRDQLDAIMVGIGTVQADNPLLTTRLQGKMGKDPVRVIVDSHLRISHQARVFNSDSKAGVILATRKGVSAEKKEQLKKMGAKVVSIDSADGMVDLKKLMLALGKLEITSLLIEGGTRIVTSALRAGIVDKTLFFYAPKILGGQSAYGITAGEGVEYISQSLQVQDVKVRRYGEDILVEGYINDKRLSW